MGNKEARVTLTDGEVITSFRQAKNKREQLRILAELQCCSQNEIYDLLSAAGEDVSMLRRRSARSSGDPRRWTEEEVDLLHLRCRQGASCEDVAIELERTVDSVYSKANEMGFAFAAGSVEEESAEGAELFGCDDSPCGDEPAAEEWTREEILSVAKLYGQGETIRRIAEVFGRSAEEVARIVRPGGAKDAAEEQKRGMFELISPAETVFDRAMKLMPKVRDMMGRDPAYLVIEFRVDAGRLSFEFDGVDIEVELK